MRHFVILLIIFFSCDNFDDEKKDVFAPNTSFYLNSYLTKLDSINFNSSNYLLSDLTYNYDSSNYSFGVSMEGDYVYYGNCSDTNTFLSLSKKYGDTLGFNYSLSVSFPYDACIETIKSINVYKNGNKVNHLFFITFKEAKIKKDIEILDSVYDSKSNLSEVEKTMYLYSAIKYEESSLENFNLRSHSLMSSFFILFSNKKLEGSFLVKIQLKNKKVIHKELEI